MQKRAAGIGAALIVLVPTMLTGSAALAQDDDEPESDEELLAELDGLPEPPDQVPYSEDLAASTDAELEPFGLLPGDERNDPPVEVTDVEPGEVTLILDELPIDGPVERPPEEQTTVSVGPVALEMLDAPTEATSADTAVDDDADDAADTGTTVNEDADVPDEIDDGAADEDDVPDGDGDGDVAGSDEESDEGDVPETTDASEDVPSGDEQPGPSSAPPVSAADDGSPESTDVDVEDESTGSTVDVDDVDDVDDVAVTTTADEPHATSTVVPETEPNESDEVPAVGAGRRRAQRR